jgi:putative SOS response-associated peptidase YedK
MCSNYLAPPSPDIFRQHFGVEPPPALGVHHVWHSKQAVFIRQHEHADVGDQAVPKREALLGTFGLIAPWNKNLKLSQVTAGTYNARSETVAEKPSYRNAWRRSQHCIVPAESIIEPDWRSGKHVPARIWLADKKPMGIAGLWERWTSPGGETILSFNMLTLNADDHPFYQQFHKPGEEKRMVVVLPEERFDDWLQARPQDSMDFIRQYPADGFTYTNS